MISSYGSAEQKGTVMGIFRSLGALARAVGPMLASTREYNPVQPVHCNRNRGSSWPFWIFYPSSCYDVFILTEVWLLQCTGRAATRRVTLREPWRWCCRCVSSPSPTYSNNSNNGNNTPRLTDVLSLHLHTATPNNNGNNTPRLTDIPSLYQHTATPNNNGNNTTQDSLMYRAFTNIQQQ